MKTLLISSVFSFATTSTLLAQYSEKSLVVNGNFEEGTAGWVTYGGSTTYRSAYDGRNSLKVTQAGNEWTGAHQVIDLNGAKTVKIAGGVKAEGVKVGAESWMIARISIEFLDSNGKAVFALGQNYTPPVVEAAGTTEWIYMNQIYKVPQGAEKIRVAPVLANASGTAYFDEIEVYTSKNDELASFANNLVSPSFESAAGWVFYGGVIQPDVVKDENLAMMASQEGTGWVGGHQEIALKEEWNTVDLTGWMKAQNVVAGDASWKQARVSVDFLDENGKMVGGYQSPAGQIVGTTDWVEFENSYSIPDGAKIIKISPVLAHCSGTVYYDNFSFVGYNKIDTPVDGNESIASGIQNGGFEQELSKWAGGKLSKKVAHTGEKSLELSQSVANWKGSDQLIKLPNGAKKINIGSYIKTEEIVAGEQSYERARIAVEFLDVAGTMVGGYQDGIGNISGTTDWKWISSNFNVPENAAVVKVTPQLANVAGSAWFDDFKVKYYDGSGSELKASFVPAPGPISTGEWYTMDVNPNVWNTHWVDWSSLLDAPAGKYGHVKAKGDDFYFENGKRAKFWGVNIVAKDNFLSKERAIETAERLAKMGCNVARLHHLDAVWSNPNIFGNKESDTRTINLEMMDRVDFFVNELKKRGIYVYLDLLVHRQFKLGDGVIAVPQEDGAKQVGHFDEKLIELQKEYASQLLSHKNKYTGFTYADEPAVMGSIIINESTMFFYFNGDVMNSQYRDNLQKKFEKFTGRTDLKLAVFAFNYGVYGGMEVVKGSPEEVSKTIEFYKKIEYDYYETMAGYMKNDLGAKFPIAGSNFPLPQTTYQEVNAMAKGLDFVATNNYWDHPKVFLLNNDWSRQLYAPIDNQSLIKNPARSLSNHFSKYAVNNKPFMVTEYNACFPNEWRLESPPMVSMYAALQGIDGLCQFDFRVEPVGNQLMSQAFSLSKQPDQLGGWVVAAPIMLGDGYITEATSKIVDPVSEKERNEFPTYNDFYDKNPHLTFITKVQSSYDGTSMGNVSSFDKYVDKESSVITSETGELSINSKVGLLLSKAPKVQGVTGALGELVLDDKGTVLSITPRKFDLPFFSVETKNMWGSVNIVSKDGLPLEQSKNFYIVAVLPCRQTGMVFNDQRTQVDKLGNVPWEAQIFDGTITLNRTGNMKIVPKTINGKDMAPIKGDQINGKTVIDMSKGRSYVYEVTIQ